MTLALNKFIFVASAQGRQFVIITAMNIDAQTYRDSLTTLLRNKHGSLNADDPKYVAGAQRVLDFMHNNWRQQKLCDVIISAKNGDLQVPFLSRYM